MIIKINTIDEYIAAQTIEMRPVLEKLRKTIRRAAPKAVEKMSWQMPTFWLGENIVHFALFKKHIGIFPGDLTALPFKDRLTGYKTTKGGIQFPLERQIDFKLVTDIVKWRVSCVESVKDMSNTDSARMTREIHEIPDYISSALDNGSLWELYNARPPYQRNDYIGWITRGKREETRKKRLNQMIDELRSGSAYMGMKYNGKKSI
ncbi:MAG: YdeI/OmpD-associated family protein [Treponema sp.]|nr:YdeI/OmpD-associated family protein [Treponema sp.]